MSRTKVSTTLLLTVDQVADLQYMSAITKVPQSELVRQAVERHLVFLQGEVIHGRMSVFGPDPVAVAMDAAKLMAVGAK